MKVFTTILKVFVALAAIAGIIYVVATYGDKLTAWAKKLLDKFCCCGCCDCCDCCDDAEVIIEAPESAEEAPQATDQDFEG